MGSFASGPRRSRHTRKTKNTTGADAVKEVEGPQESDQTDVIIERRVPGLKLAEVTAPKRLSYQSRKVKLHEDEDDASALIDQNELRNDIEDIHPMAQTQRIRSYKMIDSEQKERTVAQDAGKASRVGIAERSSKFSNILCPHCYRKFGEKAANRHIAYCKEKAKLR